MLHHLDNYHFGTSGHSYQDQVGDFQLKLLGTTLPYSMCVGISNTANGFPYQN